MKSKETELREILEGVKTDRNNYRNAWEELTKEHESLKQHNLKLTECLGEFLEYTALYTNASPDHPIWNSITKAKSLIK